MTSELTARSLSLAELTGLAGTRAWQQATEQLRKEIARQLLAQKEPCPEPGHEYLPKPSCWACARNGAFDRAARIALGRWP
jgi:hypothetical protein